MTVTHGRFPRHARLGVSKTYREPSPPSSYPPQSCDSLAGAAFLDLSSPSRPAWPAPWAPRLAEPHGSAETAGRANPAEKERPTMTSSRPLAPRAATRPTRTFAIR